MNLLEHAISELSYLHIKDKEKEEFVKKVITEFLGEFSKQEHSYMSAQIVINSFKQFMKDKSFAKAFIAAIVIIAIVLITIILTVILNGGERRAKIIKGEPIGLSVRSVFDIR